MYKLNDSVNELMISETKKSKQTNKFIKNKQINKY